MCANIQQACLTRKKITSIFGTISLSYFPHYQEPTLVPNQRELQLNQTVILFILPFSLLSLELMEYENNCVCYGMVKRVLKSK